MADPSLVTQPLNLKCPIRHTVVCVHVCSKTIYNTTLTTLTPAAAGSLSVLCCCCGVTWTPPPLWGLSMTSMDPPCQPHAVVSVLSGCSVWQASESRLEHQTGTTALYPACLWGSQSGNCGECQHVASWGKEFPLWSAQPSVSTQEHKPTASPTPLRAAVLKIRHGAMLCPHFWLKCLRPHTVRGPTSMPL